MTITIGSIIQSLINQCKQFLFVYHYFPKCSNVAEGFPWRKEDLSCYLCLILPFKIVRVQSIIQSFDMADRGPQRILHSLKPPVGTVNIGNDKNCPLWEEEERYGNTARRGYYDRARGDSLQLLSHAHLFCVAGGDHINLHFGLAAAKVIANHRDHFFLIVDLAHAKFLEDEDLMFGRDREGI